MQAAIVHRIELMHANLPTYSAAQSAYILYGDRPAESHVLFIFHYMRSEADYFSKYMINAKLCSVSRLIFYRQENITITRR